MNEMWPSFLAALAAPNQQEATLDALQRLFRERVGAKLFTVTSYDAKTRAASTLNSTSLYRHGRASPSIRAVPGHDVRAMNFTSAVKILSCVALTNFAGYRAENNAPCPRRGMPEAQGR